LPILALTSERALLLCAYEIETWRQGFFLGLLLTLGAVSIFWTSRLELGLSGARLHEPIGDPFQFRLRPRPPWLLRSAPRLLARPSLRGRKSLGESSRILQLALKTVTIMAATIFTWSMAATSIIQASPRW